jgi:hypothetical protein
MAKQKIPYQIKYLSERFGVLHAERPRSPAQLPFYMRPAPPKTPLPAHQFPSPHLAKSLKPQVAGDGSGGKRDGAGGANRVQDGAGEAAEEPGAAPDGQHGDGAVGGQAGSPGGCRRRAVVHFPARRFRGDGRGGRRCPAERVLLWQLLGRCADGGVPDGVRPLQPQPRPWPRHIHLQVRDQDHR